jgi:hypothetical protein
MTLECIKEGNEYPAMGPGPCAVNEAAPARMIRVWPFEYAPAGLRNHSVHAGDEDWLAIVPPRVEVPPWMQSGSGFGVEVSQMPMANGSTLCIGVRGADCLAEQADERAARDALYPRTGNVEVQPR